MCVFLSVSVCVCACVCTPSHSQSTTLCALKNSPRAADVFVSVVCLFDTAMSRPRLADCSRSDRTPSPTSAPHTPSPLTPRQPNVIVQQCRPPPHTHTPTSPSFLLTPALYDVHALIRLKKKNTPAKQQCLFLFSSTLLSSTDLSRKGSSRLPNFLPSSHSPTSLFIFSILSFSRFTLLSGIFPLFFYPLF